MARRLAFSLWGCALVPAAAFALCWRWPLERALALTFALATAAAAAATWWLTHRYVPALRAVRSTLEALPEGCASDPAAQLHTADEPRELLELVRRRTAVLQQELRSLKTFGEIDQMLLGSAGLEQILEALLARVQSVMRCDGVSITLRDADAPGRGRVYLAAAGQSDLPVVRVALDADMVATLAAETHGLTIARCEEGRHSFLKPLADAGAELFWVWPVSVAERVEAILAVGYREVPHADPHLSRCGAQFTARLGAALEKSAREELLYRQAHFDPLTALPNRLLFRERLARELAAAAAGRSGALLYIDLDHFKRVNDGAGHAAGDQLLIEIAQRLRACAGETDTVARLAGDEFTMILRNVSGATAARRLAERVIESLKAPVVCAGREHRCGASIGVTLFPEDGATSIDELVRNADTALYRAKDLGRGRVMFFDASMRVRPITATGTGLHRALKRREFSLFYQPQFALRDGALVGSEALLRWHSPREGVRAPEQFVPAAEESGVIVDIGGWVLDAACAQLAAWRDERLNPPRLSINICAQQLAAPDFAASLRRALDKHSLPPELLEIEVTQRALEGKAAAAALERLAQWGVQLALDDFGTGYSALACLSQHPINVVKVERALLIDVPDNPDSGALVDTVIVMAHALGKRVVAKGIERIEQLDFLRERRCDAAQGFYLARPLPATGMTELLHARALSLRSEPVIRAVG
jgi:diguanylate cyclase (GGDEF)-like protein